MEQFGIKLEHTGTCSHTCTLFIQGSVDSQATRKLGFLHRKCGVGGCPRGRCHITRIWGLWLVALGTFFCSARLRGPGGFGVAGGSGNLWGLCVLGGLCRFLGLCGPLRALVVLASPGALVGLGACVQALRPLGQIWLLRETWIAQARAPLTRERNTA